MDLSMKPNESDNSDDEHVYTSDSECSSNPSEYNSDDDCHSNMEDNEDYEDDGWREWKSDDEDFPSLPYSASSGYTPPEIKPTSEMEFFQLFFTNELLEKIVKETNRYVAVKIQKSTPLPQFSSLHNWVDVTVVELKAFFGVIMNMGIQNKPCIYDYFSDEWPERQPFFKDVFARRRFCQIFWYLQVEAPPVMDPQSKNKTRGRKVKCTVDYIDNKCREHYIPEQKIFVSKMDNSRMITQKGLRVYVLAESTTGYISAFEPHYGSIAANNFIRPDLPLTTRIPLHLCNKLLQKSNGTGYHLYTDRFFTGVILAKELHKMGIQTTGTISRTRKSVPEMIRKKKLKFLPNVPIAHRKNGIMVLSWQNHKYTHILSTLGNAATELVRIRGKWGDSEYVRKPSVLLDYNKYMKVNRADRFIDSYSFGRKTMTWWRKMFFWMFEVSIANSQILFNKHMSESGQPTKTQVQFRKALLLQLVGDVRNRSKKSARFSRFDTEQRLNNKSHFIYSDPDGKSKDCAVCSNRKAGHRKVTTYYCETCTRRPGLHLGACFKRYHTEKKFKLY